MVYLFNQLMKTFPLKISLSAVALLFFFSAGAQQFTNLLKKLATDFPQEKLYLQLDRSIYNPGETIWFKAYLFAGNFPSLLSKTIYTELTDTKGNVLEREISPVILSSTAGSINIPENASGTVFVRAYTKWMLNFDTAYLFTKAISIIPSKKPTGKLSAGSPSNIPPVAASAASMVVQFFPEGGDLVTGVASRVAFKSTDKMGMPVSITGDILDSKGAKITSFASMHDGMGKFMLQPDSGERYKAVWKDTRGEINEGYLPIAKLTGIVLQVEYPGDQIEFKIKYAANHSPYPFVYVVAQMNQHQLYRAKANISKTMTSSGIISTEKFPSGIVQLTVFSPEEQPLAERILFVNLLSYSITTNLTASVRDTGRRKKNIIEIEVPDTLSCNLSVAVTDADLNPGRMDDNIYSHLLINSDIKGYVYNPAYYFSSEEDSVANQLDLVMMTNGWRRFKWEELLAGHFPTIKYLPENYISIEGQVKGLKQKDSIAQREINGILELKDKRIEYLNTSLQPDGKFGFSGMVFFDTAKLFYQFNKDKKKTLTTRADFDIKSNLLSDPLFKVPINQLLTMPAQADNVEYTKLAAIYQQQSNELELYKVKTLKTVVLKTTIKSKQTLVDEEYTSGFFSGDPNGQTRTILPEDDPYFLASQNLFSFLQGRVAGLQITLIGNNASVTWRSFETSLFVNEISQASISMETGRIIEDPSYILSLPMSEIAMAKIFDPPFFGAGSSSSGGQGGAISVYLKRGRTGNQMAKGLDYTLLPGYSTPKEFYSPAYSMPDQTSVPDYRTTLYWNPFIFTDKNNRRIALTFYNNDFTKKMKVIVEGCNEDGKLTRIEKIL